MSVLVKADDFIPLSVVLEDGKTNRHPIARVFDNDNNELVMSPVALTHIAEGLYRNDSIQALASYKRVFAVYEVFIDSGHTIPSLEYQQRTEEIFDIEVIDTGASTADYKVCVPDKLEIPYSGTKTYRFVIYLFNDQGLPVDPDGSSVTIHIENINNNEILGDTPCQREQVGVYFYRYTVTSGDAEQPLWVEFLFERGGESFLVGDVTEAIKTDARTVSLDTIKLTTQRSNNLDNLDVAVSSRQSSVAATSQYNTIRSDIAGVQTHLSTQDTNIASIKSDTTKIGNPINGTLAADNVQSFANDLAILNLLAKLGIPSTGTIAGDIAALEAHLDAQDVAIASVKADTDLIGMPTFGSLAADDDAILAAIHDSDNLELVTQGQITALDAKIGMPANGTVSADIASIQADTTVLTNRLTEQRALNLDHLDVYVSSREAESDASWRYTSLFNGIQAILAGIGAIPNNTSFVGIVPPILVLPPQPVTKTYKFFVNLFDAQGLPEDPDAGVTYRIEDVTGVIVVGTTAMFRTDIGAFYCQYPVEWDDPERTLFVIFSYSKGGIPLQQTRITEVQEYESKLDLLLQRLTQTRASNLDRLDVAVSTRASEVDLANYYADLAARSQAILDEANIIQTILGTPVVSIANDLATIHSWVTKIGNPLTGTLAGDVSQVRSDTQRIGVPVSGTLVGDILTVLARIADLKFDVSLVKADTANIGVPIGGTVATGIDTILAKLGPSASTIEELINNIDISQLLAILGTPQFGTIALDIANVRGIASSTQISVGTIASQTSLLPGINSSVSAISASVSTINPKLDAIQDSVDGLSGIEPKVDDILGAIGTLESCCQRVQNDIQAIPINPLRDDDARLAFLDAPISSRATPADCGAASTGASFVDICGVIDNDDDELFGLLEELPEGELLGLLDGNEDIIGIMEDEE